MSGRHLAFGRLFATFAALFALVAVAVAPAGAAEGDSLELELEALEDFDFSGTAVITEEDNAITVEIEVEGDDVEGGHPVHIHEGTCNELDPNPLYSLADIDEDGQSSTLVDGVTLDDLLADDFAVNAHVSAEDIGTYTTCGNIKVAGEDGEDDAEEVDAAPAEDATEDEDDEAAAAAPADDEDEDDGEDAAPADAEDDEDTPAVGGGDTTTTSTTSALPASGVGSAFGGDAGASALLTVLGALAVALAVAGVALRAREQRA